MKTAQMMVGAVTAVLLLAVAVRPVQAANNGNGSKKPCLAVLVGSKQKMGNGNSDDDREFGGGQGNGNGNNAASFQATKVLDVDFAILFSADTLTQYGNSHWVEFRLIGPRGSLYQSIAIPFTADANRGGERHRVPGYPDLIPVQVLKPLHGKSPGMIAKVRLPIAGTPIVNNSLYGRWTAVAYIDGESVSCSAPAEFVLTP